MGEKSSSGHAAPSVKTIDVKVNLLGQRIHERHQVFLKCRKKVIFIGLALLSFSVAMPIMFVAKQKLASRTDRTSKLAAATREKANEAVDAAEKIKPRLVASAAVKESQAKTTRFLNVVVDVLNATSSRVALTSVKADVVGGEAKVTCRGEAEDFSSAESFALLARQGGASDDGIHSTHRNELLGKGGISFEFSKRVQL